MKASAWVANQAILPRPAAQGRRSRSFHRAAQMCQRSWWRSCCSQGKKNTAVSDRYSSLAYCSRFNSDRRRRRCLFFHFRQIVLPGQNPALAKHGSNLKREDKCRKHALTTSNTTLIIRLQLGQTAISSPSRRSPIEISKRSPHGQG